MAPFHFLGAKFANYTDLYFSIAQKGIFIRVIRELRT